MWYWILIQLCFFKLWLSYTNYSELKDKPEGSFYKASHLIALLLNFILFESSRNGNCFLSYSMSFPSIHSPQKILEDLGCDAKLLLSVRQVCGRHNETLSVFFAHKLLLIYASWMIFIQDHLNHRSSYNICSCAHRLIGQVWNRKSSIEP